MRRQRLAAAITSLIAVPAIVLAMSPSAIAASGDRYVALGDSYASGVGADGYLSDSGTCSRSSNAYPALWAAASTHLAYASVACSEATTTSVINTQLSALSSSTTLVSITVGGNDVGFASIMQTCVLGGTDQCVKAVQAAENLAVSALPGLLDAVYNGIATRAPRARVIVLGYPVFYQLGTFCVGLSTLSHEKINEGIDLVDGIISAAAKRHGFVFGDVRPAFVGHQLCSGNKWLHALNIVNITYSYHPTAAGQSGGYYPVFKAAAG